MSRRPSPQTLLVLEALTRELGGWRHGYDLARETGVASGTLYPVLIRLAERGMVEACWDESVERGRPRRHLYRITAEGVALARQQQPRRGTPLPRPQQA
jgi:DNA-binding PadR family transcriptional regulator